MAYLRKLKSGRWQAVIRKRGHPSSSSTFRTKAAAQNWARTREDEMVRGNYHDHSVAERMTIAEMLARYAENITPRKRSAVKEMSRIRILTDALGKYSLAGLSAELVIDFVDDRLEDVTADTVRKDLATLSHAIDTSMALWGVHLVANPVTVAKGILRVTKTLTTGRERDRRVENNELERIVAASDSERFGPVAWFAIETAMRRGEIAKARPEHYKGDRLLVPETKTDKPREVPLTTRARDLLDTITPASNGTIFGLEADSITQVFSRAKKKAGIEDIRFHDLRHEATSRFFEMGLSIEEVASITGHSDWKTLKRYTHINPSRLAMKLV